MPNPKQPLRSMLPPNLGTMATMDIPIEDIMDMEDIMVDITVIPTDTGGNVMPKKKLAPKLKPKPIPKSCFTDIIIPTLTLILSLMPPHTLTTPTQVALFTLPNVKPKPKLKPNPNPGTTDTTDIPTDTTDGEDTMATTTDTDIPTDTGGNK